MPKRHLTTWLRLPSHVCGLTALACLFIISPALAETSSWVTRSEGSKPPASKAPAPAQTGKAVQPKQAADKAAGGATSATPAPGAPAAAAPPKPVSVRPAEASPLAPSPASTHDKTLGSKVDLSGDDAAYLAYDQGRFLTALELAQKAAEQGDPQAHTLIGRILSEGSGVPRDEPGALRWYSKGAELGDFEAAYAAGVMYAQGRGAAKDMKKAADLLEAAAMKGHPAAHYNLALLFLKGEGKPENPHRAGLHLRYAAEKGLPAAQYDLAMMLTTGQGGSANAAEAMDWLEKASRSGHAEAELEYAIALFKTGRSLDERRGAELLQRAAEKGIPVAQNRLARCFANARGVALDPVQAAKWHLLAKAAGLEDQQLDQAIRKLSNTQRAAAEKAVAEWLDKNSTR